MLKKCIFISFIAFHLMVFTEGQLLAQYTDEARKIINTLASPEMKGRGYTGGDSLAATYLTTVLNEYGIESLGESYYQPFILQANTFPHDLYLQANNKTLKIGSDFVVAPWSGALSGKYKYTTLTREAMKDESSLIKFMQENKDKIVVLDTFKISINKQVLTPRQFAFFNPFHNSGFIILEENQPIFGAATYAVPHFAAHAKRSFFTKNKGKLKIDVTNQLKTNYITNNVIGYIPGETDTCVLLTAHYDHLGQLGTSTFYNGAHDNASGSAAISILGKKIQETNPYYSYLIVYFSGEESGLLGSYHFVENSLVPLSKIKMVINIDLAGSGDKGITLVNGKTHPDVSNAFDSINSIRKYFPVISQRGPAANSDHHPFHEKNVKSIFIYTMGDYKAYHIPEDSAENIPLTKFNELIFIVWDYLCTLDNGLPKRNE